jgi:hypothetical protein
VLLAGFVVVMAFVASPSVAANARVSTVTGPTVTWAGVAMINPWPGDQRFGTGQTFFRVPTLACKSGENSGVYFWIGLDGLVNTPVEQIGVQADCVNGKPSYWGRYEHYMGDRDSTIPINSVTFRPGDYIQVFWNWIKDSSDGHSTYSFDIANWTAGGSYEHWVTAKTSDIGLSMECVAEGMGGTDRQQPNFSAFAFYNCEADEALRSAGPTTSATTASHGRGVFTTRQPTQTHCRASFCGRAETASPSRAPSCGPAPRRTKALLSSLGSTARPDLGGESG